MRGAIQAPRRALAAGVVLVAVGALAATQLHASSPQRLLAKGGSDVGSATADQERAFGGEPIVVVLRGDLQGTLSGLNLSALARLESRIQKLGGVQTVFGPGSFVNQAVEQMSRVVRTELGPAAERADKAARAAVAKAKARGASQERLATIDEETRLRALGPLRKQYQQLFIRFGYLGLPSLFNRNFVLQLVFGSGIDPKRRFAWLFPDRNHALVIVRLRAGLEDARVRALGSQIERLADDTPLARVETSVAGPPLVVAQATSAITDELLRLAPIVLVAMALALLVGLGPRARALHLLVPAGLAAALTAGLSWPLGLGFTAATLAALPVVLGLALDYAIQLQARYWTERSAGADPRAAAVGALRRVGPTLSLAAGTMVLGFMVLLISPVPLINRLGLTLALGVACSLAAVLVFTGPLMVTLDREGARPPRLALPSLALSRRARLSALGLATFAACAGLALSASTPIESDLRKLVNADMPQVRDLERLQRELGISGHIRVAVTAKDVADPKVLAWMAQVEPRILALDPAIRPGPNLAAILTTGGTQPVSDSATARRLLRLIPPAFVRAVVTPDRRRAELSFGVPLGSADRQAKLIDRMQRLLETASAGVDAQVAGLLALSAAGVTGMQDERPWLLLLAAAVIFLLLYSVRRRLDRALIPLVPALLGAGTTALIVAAGDFHLSPLSAGLDPLVLAVGVEFGLLLEARYREGREAGLAPAQAARSSAELLGGPVAVSAGTVAVGFAVLAFSQLPVLRQFGLVAATELVLCVLASIVLVPRLAAAADLRRAAPRKRHRLSQREEAQVT